MNFKNFGKVKGVFGTLPFDFVCLHPVLTSAGMKL